MRKKTLLFGTIALGMGATAVAFGFFAYVAVAQMLDDLDFNEVFKEDIDEYKNL
jgi:hypothetical protein